MPATVNGRAGRVRAGTVQASVEPWEKTSKIIDTYRSYINYLENSGRAKAYVHQIHFFVGEGNARKADWEPLVRWCVTNNVERVGQLNPDLLSRWLCEVRANKSDHGYGQAVEIMNRWLRWLVDNDELDRMPVKVKRPTVQEAEISVFTDAEIDAMHKVVQKENVRDQAIFWLLVDTGMRAGELCSLTMSDLRLDRAEVVIRAENAKSKKSRTLTLTESLPRLRKYLQQRPENPGTDFVFLSFYAPPVYSGGSNQLVRANTGKLQFSQAGITRMGLYTLVRKWGTLANVTDARCSPHTYRHYYAVSYLRAGGDVFSLQRLLGHSKLDVTQRYARLVGTDIRKRQQQFSPALRLTQGRYRKAGPAE